MNKDTTEKTFRDYSNANENVKSLYRDQRTRQCKCYVERLAQKYNPKEEALLKMSCWSALQSLSSLIDQSDPDVSLPNLQHAFQTAEGMREAQEPEWFQVRLFGIFVFINNQQ